GEALGVVYLDDRVRRGAFGVRELAWVRLVGTLAAVAISDAKNQLLLRRAARRAERAEAKAGVELAQREAELDIAERELARTRDARETRFSYASIIGQSEAVRGLLKLVDRVTSADVPVLILGESGSGKELVARAIHENGPRSKLPFVSENCGAIPEGLLEPTLFGHVRGAFTGATRPRAGLFEVADHGTFFLDEIAEMSLAMQTKLLRVLQNGEVHPVGSESPRFVDVRVIGATHRDLEALVLAGKFREDLYYRLNVVSLRVPPLRERPGDVPLLVRHFVSRYAEKRKVAISKAAMDALSAYRWPGNIRQLENEVRRALVLADDIVTPDVLSPDVIARESSEVAIPDGLNLRGRVDALEGELVRTALKRTAGNQTRAAELLGLSRFGLQKMIKRLQIGAQ
ncbi:MAG TPA: sigma-54 dependent transcriptional regulator, partial [Polyangiaceae bacterium]